MNINEMSRYEVNLAIAKVRGEQIIYDDLDPGEVPARNYCREWEYCGPLLEEMAQHDPDLTSIRKRLSMPNWGNLPTDNPLASDAVARAYLLLWITEEG